MPDEYDGSNHPQSVCTHGRPSLYDLDADSFICDVKQFHETIKAKKRLLLKKGVRCKYGIGGEAAKVSGLFELSWFCPKSGRSKRVAELTSFSKVMTC